LARMPLAWHKKVQEFGVGFLMFSIGLEFSLPKLLSMRHAVFGLGLAQVLVTIIMAMASGFICSQFFPAISISVGRLPLLSAVP